jgi:hypothetical protein
MMAPSIRLGRGEMLERLLHPVALAALGLLLVNDHLLKATNPGWLTGKLSDVAVMALLPFVIIAVLDLAGMALARGPAPGRRALLWSVGASVALFTLIEVTTFGADAYRWGLAVAQWPIRALDAAIKAGTVPDLVPVRLTSDVSDLLTLPAAGIILLLSRRWGRDADRGERHAAVVRRRRAGGRP